VIPRRLFFSLLVFAISLIVLQLGTGIWLFVEKYGLSPGEVYTYFAGNEAEFIMPKTFEGLIETAVPHFLAISTTIFVFAHFLLFPPVLREKKQQLLISSPLSYCERRYLLCFWDDLRIRALRLVEAYSFLEF